MDINLFNNAAILVAKHLRATPLMGLTMSDERVFLKLENQQVTGSFKARGALNRIASLSKGERSIGVVTASTGNHGMGMANACKELRVKGKVYLPEIVIDSKHAKLKALGIETELLGSDSLQTELLAKKIARQEGKVWISPYNDLAVVAGQGTIALEIIEELPDVKRVFVTVGGGGLISGIGSVMKKLKPDVEIIGCQPLHSPEMYASVKAGKIISIEDSKPTLSDGSAGGVEEGSITFDICKNVVDRWELITENEIEHAVALAHEQAGEKIEGAAGVALAAWLRDCSKTDRDVVVICGGNIDSTIWEQIIAKSE